MSNLRSLLASTEIAALTVACGLVLYAVLVRILRRIHKRIPLSITGVAIPLTQLFAPLRALIPAIVLAAALPFLGFPAGVRSVIGHVVALWIIAVLAWLSIRILAMARDMIMRHHQLYATDNLQARRIYTQLHLIEQILTAIIVVFALAIMLMTFSEVQQIGTSILASAGVVGIIAGFAAQRSIGALFAGIQIAISQPIRIDDIVIVEGEWGRIEEITLTYVVMKCWDERRLMVPITYFIEKPFQNWTRTTAHLLGTVFIYADYTLPVQEIRGALHRILTDTPLWDGRTWNLQVTNATERSIELRALMSAVDSSTAWDLRCHVREKLLEFLQQRYPPHLPRVRVEIERNTSELADSPQHDDPMTTHDRPP